MTIPRIPTNSDDLIDSRDVIEAIAWLTEEPEEGEELEVDDDLEALKALAEEAEQYAADWRYGEVLIRDSYFKEYAMDLADSIGAIDSNAGWPLSYIDWDDAADALRSDYTSVEFDGVTYWVR
jgi:hypothetical protein